MSGVSEYPSSLVLRDGLQAILDPKSRHSVAICDRQPNRWLSTFPTEIVTCQVDGRWILRLFCKYETGVRTGSYGHWGGVAYEQRVYRDVLQPLFATVPRFYGSCDDRRGSLWFVLEYLDGSLPVSKAPELDAMLRAAEWIGAFHARADDQLRSESPSFLLRYELGYYHGWVDRTLRLSSAQEHSTWLPRFGRRFKRAVSLLTSEPLTVIHGEYYPANVQIQAAMIRPVDWESAAVGPGEIDLASLTEAWPRDIAESCEQAYCRKRWPNVVPPDFARRLDLARLYLHLRWLGSPKEWRTAAGPTWRLGQVQQIAERQALL